MEKSASFAKAACRRAKLKNFAAGRDLTEWVLCGLDKAAQIVSQIAAGRLTVHRMSLGELQEGLSRNPEAIFWIACALVSVFLGFRVYGWPFYGVKMTPNSQKLSFIRDRYIDGVIGKEIFPTVTSVPYADNPLAIVSDFFLRKATKTLDAMCVLCERGFAEDALVLGRTIFELAVHLRTIASPDSTEQRQHKAKCFIYDGERQRGEKLKEMAELKQQGKCLSWITELESQNPTCESTAIPNDFVPLKNFKTTARGEWECWYYFLYWSVSKLAHPSGLGSHTYVQDSDDEAEVSRAIAVALTMHYHLTDTVLTLLDLEKLRPRLEECMKNVLAQIRD
jgi:Family of unknown function (DUF5677)